MSSQTPKPYQPKPSSIWRVEVIEKSINIETMMSALISQYYLKRVSQAFLLDFLGDEMCSFALKRRVLFKAFPALRHIEQDVNRLNSIRNYFAHCGMEIRDVGSDAGRIADPKDSKKSLNLETLHAEFVEKEPGITIALGQAMRDAGIELLPA